MHFTRQIRTSYITCSNLILKEYGNPLSWPSLGSFQRKYPRIKFLLSKTTAAYHYVEQNTLNGFNSTLLESTLSRYNGNMSCILMDRPLYKLNKRKWCPFWWNKQEMLIRNLLTTSAKIAAMTYHAHFCDKYLRTTHQLITILSKYTNPCSIQSLQVQKSPP